MKKDRGIAQKKLQEFEDKVNMKPWLKMLILSAICGLVAVLFYFRRKKMYCFKDKINFDEEDNQYPLMQ